MDPEVSCVVLSGQKMVRVSPGAYRHDDFSLDPPSGPADARARPHRELWRPRIRHPMGTSRAGPGSGGRLARARARDPVASVSRQFPSVSRHLRRARPVRSGPVRFLLGHQIPCHRCKSRSCGDFGRSPMFGVTPGDTEAKSRCDNRLGRKVSSLGYRNRRDFKNRAAPIGARSEKSRNRNPLRDRELGRNRMVSPMEWHGSR